MAQKQKLRPSPLDEPPTASSSDSGEEEQQPRRQPSSQHEEEEVSSAEEEGEEASSSSEEEDEDLPPPVVSKTPPPPPPTNPNPIPNPQPSSSDSETDSGSETESEPEPTPVKVKPLASKPMDQPPKPKPQPSPAPSPAPAQPKSASKRAADSIKARAADPKRAKNKATDSTSGAAAAGASDDEMEEDGKKPSDQSKRFQRLWTEEHEVSIMKGMLEYTSKTGLDPLKVPNTNAFCDLMKKSLHFEFSSNQLREKIRRIRKKFEPYGLKEKNGEALVFSKPQDQKAYEFWRKLWGTEDSLVANGTLDKPKSNGNAAKAPKKKETVSRSKKPKPETKPDHVPLDSEKLMQIDQKPDSGDATLFLRELARFKEGVGGCKMDEDDVKWGLELIGESKRAELRGRWKKLQHAEMELFANRSQLIGEQSKLILEALRSSNH